MFVEEMDCFMFFFYCALLLNVDKKEFMKNKTSENFSFYAIPLFSHYQVVKFYEFNQHHLVQWLYLYKQG